MLQLANVFLFDILLFPLSFLSFSFWWKIPSHFPSNILQVDFGNYRAQSHLICSSVPTIFSKLIASSGMISIPHTWCGGPPGRGMWYLFFSL